MKVRRTEHVSLISAALVASTISGCFYFARAPRTEVPQPDGAPDATVLSFAFSSDSRYVAQLGDNGDVAIWDVTRTEAISKTNFEGELSSLDLASRRIFAIVGPGAVRICDAQDGKLRSIPSHAGTPPFVLFDERGERIAIAGRNRTVNIWSIETGLPVRKMPPPPGTDDAEIRPGEAFNVVLVGSGVIHVQPLEGRVPPIALEFPFDATVAPAISRDGRSLASLSPNGAAEVRDVATGRVRASLKPFRTPPRALTLSPDGSLLAVIVDDAVEIWDTVRPEPLEQFETHPSASRGIRFSPDGYTLAWVGAGGKAMRFQFPAGDLIGWGPGGVEIAEETQQACTHLAEFVRYRLAREPFRRGLEHLEERELPQAQEALAAAGNLFPKLPGLAAARARLDEQLAQQSRAASLFFQVAALEAGGDYERALALLRNFLQDPGAATTSAQRARAEQLVRMLRHFDSAESHRRAEKPDLVEGEFARGLEIAAELEQLHPRYKEMRDRHLVTMREKAATFFSKHRYRELVQTYSNLARMVELHPEESLRLGEAYEKLDKREKARRAYESVPKNTAEYVAAREKLARIARLDGHLDLASVELRKALETSENPLPLVIEFAAIRQRLGDVEGAVEAWIRVGKMQPDSPRPYEKIGELEIRRERWDRAAEAFEEAYRRTNNSRPQLRVQIAQCHERAGRKENALQQYVALLDIAKNEKGDSWLGKNPRQKVLNWIRDLGFVRHRGQWLPRDLFLSEQGWIRDRDVWLRPEEARLHEVIERLKGTESEKLRTRPDTEYQKEASEKRLTKGMNRREVIDAWGFFEDQNLVALEDGKTVYEQLVFPGGRRAYLRNGRVCFWSE